MSIWDRYPQPSYNVDDMIALLWKKICKLEHIEQTIDNSTNTNIINYNNNETLTPHRHARYIFDKDDTNYVQLQSSCEDDTYIYLFYVHQDDTVENCFCRKVSKTSFDIISTKEYVGGGHANGVTYNSSNNKIYLLNSNNASVYVINPLTLEIESTLNTGMSDYTKAIAYDHDRDQFYIGRVTGNGTQNEVYIYEHTLSGFECTGQFTVNSWENLGIATQDWAYNNDCLYAMTSKPNAICLISVKEGTQGNRICCYELHSNECTIGELEGIDFWHGHCRITSTRLSATYGTQYITQLFDTDNYYGTVSNSRNGDVYSCLQKVPIQLYVDITSTTHNPDGSLEKPFKEIWEAVDVVGCAYPNNARVIVKPGSYATIGLHNGVSCYIEGDGADNTCGIKGIFVTTGAHLYLKKMRITRNLQMLTERNYANLLENGGHVTMQNCWLETGSSGDYNVYVNTGSVLTLLNTVFTDSNAGLGYLVGDTGTIIRDQLGYDQGMKVTKNNSSGLVLPPFQKCELEDTAIEVTTSLNYSVRLSQKYWQFIMLALQYQGAYMYCFIPTTSTTTNAVVTSAEGYCKFHFDASTNKITCTHNDLTGLYLKSYLLVN